MATKAFKQEKIQAYKSNFEKAKVVILSNYKGLSVEEIQKLRRALQKENSDFTVTKNTLCKIAVEGTKFEALKDVLTGETAVAFGFEDEVAPAKVLAKFIKETKKGEILAAVLDGKLMSADDAKKLAELPSREELYAKILGSINSPASGIANTINGVMRNLVYAMEQVRKQKESA